MADKKVITPEDMGDTIRLGVRQPDKYDFDTSTIDLSRYVVKGENGSWGDRIPYSTDLYTPERLVTYGGITANKPFSTTNGVAISIPSINGFATQGDRNEENWVTTLAFSVNRRISITQRIGDRRLPWVAIPTSELPSHTLIASGVAPAVNASVVLEIPSEVRAIYFRNKVVNVSVRADTTSRSVMLNGPIEIVANGSQMLTGVRVTNRAEYNIPQGTPLTAYIVAGM